MNFKVKYICVMGLTLTLILLGCANISIWGDEGFILFSNQKASSWFNMVSVLSSHETNPLLYNSLIYGLQKVLGLENLIPYRLVSVLFWLVGVMVSIKYVRNKKDEDLTLHYVVWILLNSTLILLATQIRSYSLLFMLGAIFWVECMRQKPRTWFCILLSFLITQTHFAGIVYVFSVLIYLNISKKINFKRDLLMVLGLIPSLLQVCYLVLFQAQNYYPNNIKWFIPLTWKFPFLIIHQFFVGNVITDFRYINSASIIFLILICLILLYGILKNQHDKENNEFLKSFVASALILWLLDFMYRPYIIPRALIPFISPCLYFMALTTSQLKRRWVITLTTFVLIINIILFQEWLQFAHTPNYKLISETISLRKKEEILIVDFTVDQAIMEYFLPDTKGGILLKDFLQKPIPKDFEYHSYWYVGRDPMALIKHFPNYKFTMTRLYYSTGVALYYFKSPNGSEKI